MAETFGGFFVIREVEGETKRVTALELPTGEWSQNGHIFLASRDWKGSYGRKRH